MNTNPTILASIKTRAAYLEHVAARRAVESKMEEAILAGCGAVVEVTLMAAGKISVSAKSPEACSAACQIMTLAGCALTSSEWDEELGMQFNYYVHAES